MLCLFVYLADFVPHVFDMLFVSMSSHSMSKLDIWFNLLITGVQKRLDLQDLILRVVPSRVEMVATNCPPCKKCHGVADVLCVACDLRACIDCITWIHAVSQNIIQYLNWAKSRVVFMYFFGPSRRRKNREGWSLIIDHIHEDCDVQKDNVICHLTWNNPAWSDANSADSDGFEAIEQPSEMI